MTSGTPHPELDPNEKAKRYYAILSVAERELDARTRRRRVALAGGGTLSLLVAVFITWLIGPLEKPSAPTHIFMPPSNPISSNTEPAWISNAVASGTWLDAGTAAKDWLLNPGDPAPRPQAWLATDDELDELMALYTQVDERGVIRIGGRSGSRTVLARDLNREATRSAQEIQPDPQAQ